MNGTWGNALGVTIYGESHGTGLGVVINNLPPGFKIDMDAVRSEMDRRKPGTSNLTTPRKEADAFEILSGYFEEHTTGAPLAIVIRNTNQRSRDYSKTKDVLRPGHADWTAYERFGGFHDYRGGGHFSGRLTSGLVFAGAVAQQMLATLGIQVGARILSVGEVSCGRPKLQELLEANILDWRKDAFPAVNMERQQAMIEQIDMARESDDSVGGRIHVVAKGLPAGLGQPFFNSMESRIAHMLFSVPAIKAIEFGTGFDMTKLRGSQSNDPIALDGDKVVSTSNNNGGMLGGITNGMPIEITVGIKPTASIGVEQNTVNYKTKTEQKLSVEGRHDPCIVPRVVPVLESVLAIVILDAILDENRDLSAWKRG